MVSTRFAHSSIAWTRVAHAGGTGTSAGHSSKFGDAYVAGFKGASEAATGRFAQHLLDT